ncbi:autophagy-related protein 13-domain-containing protein [Obelidium mucronatum]|nr:autophagy-related protein 13-domain-containing protein [Obelidium mucronatum]
MTSHLASSLASSRSNNSNPNNQTSSSKPTTDEAIVQNLFSKVAQIIVDARVISNSSSNSNNSNNSSSNKEKENSGVKSNKWFNLDTVDIDPLRGELKFWKTMIAQISSQSQQQQQQQQHTQMQPLILDIYLDISDLYSTSQHLVLKDEVSLRRHKVPHEYLVGSSMDPITGTSFDVKKKRILLESWQLTLLQPPPRSPPETPVMYKKCVMFFRSLYTHIRLLPSYRLHRRLAKTDRDQQQQPPFRIGYRLSSSRVLPVDEAGLGDTLLPAPTTTTQSSSFTMKQQHLQHRQQPTTTAATPSTDFRIQFRKPGNLNRNCLFTRHVPRGLRFHCIRSNASDCWRRFFSSR